MSSSRAAACRRTGRAGSPASPASSCPCACSRGCSAVSSSKGSQRCTRPVGSRASGVAPTFSREVLEDRVAVREAYQAVERSVLRCIAGRTETGRSARASPPIPSRPVGSAPVTDVSTRTSTIALATCESCGRRSRSRRTHRRGPSPLQPAAPLPDQQSSGLEPDALARCRPAGRKGRWRISSSGTPLARGPISTLSSTSSHGKSIGVVAPFASTTSPPASEVCLGPLGEDQSPFQSKADRGRPGHLGSMMTSLHAAGYIASVVKASTGLLVHSGICDDDFVLSRPFDGDWSFPAGGCRVAARTGYRTVGLRLIRVKKQLRATRLCMTQK